MSRHLHLDLLGGLSGDMFISAMLDVFPDLATGLQQVIEQAGFPDLVSLESAPFDDGVLTGTRFTVSAEKEAGHAHRHYSEIKSILEGSALSSATRKAALAMFHEIAVVEAAIHGKEVEAVAFHEVGAWDSIADIVLAAHLIESAGADSWSCSVIPAGRGFVETAHGRLPVPAPATARLLEGFELLDDGIEGERVTPTGAVILRYLKPARRLPKGFTLQGTGYGFGTKRFPGISNAVRVAMFDRQIEPEVSPPVWDTDQVMRLSFELDDQTPEDIALAVTTIAEAQGVLDVARTTISGKKGRQATSVTVLCSPVDADSVTALCFNQTVTLGIRRELIDRAILKRSVVTVQVDGRDYRVKLAKRPGGYTAKLEMDDLMMSRLDRQARQTVRIKAETLALEQAGEF